MNTTQPEDKGGIIDVPFVPGFYPEMMPGVLDARLACSGFGIARPHPRRFRFADLGCGYGFNAALIAALYPQAEIVAIDALPEHCDAQVEFARRAGLANLSVRCDSLATLDATDGPYDYISLNAVISWISAEDRHAAWRFASSALSENGCLFASYNAMPGLVGVDALRRLIQYLAARTSGATLERMAHAFSKISEMAAQHSAFFRHHPELLPMVKEFETRSLNYLAHEYMTMQWHAFYVADVHAELTGYGLSFAGGLCREDLAAPIGEELSADPLTDYLVDRQYRRDVFVRAERQTSETGNPTLSSAAMVSLIPHMSVDEQCRELSSEPDDDQRHLLSLLAMGASAVREDTTAQGRHHIDAYNRALLAPTARRLDVARPFALAGLSNGFRLTNPGGLDADDSDWESYFRRNGLSL